MHIRMLSIRKVNSNMYYFMLVIVCMYIFFVGQYTNQSNLALVSVLILFLGNICFAYVYHRNKSAFFIIFHFLIFLFILSRPTISMFKGDSWVYTFRDSTVYTTLFILLLSLSGLYEGGFWGLNSWVKRNKPSKISNIPYNINMRKILFVVVVIALLCSILKELTVYLSFAGKYESIYLEQTASVPWYISVISGISPFLMIIYLACNPSKNKSIVVLVLYVAGSLPSVFMGSRNVIMLRVLFMGIYFILRELYEKKKKWIGRREILLVVILIPIVIMALGAMNYTREDSDVPDNSPMYLVTDFFYKQGTSFDTVLQTVEYKERLLNDTYINYSFGEFVDFVLYNGISNKILGTEELEYGNGIKKATISNNLAHRVSYIALGESYLQGHGRGTTYFSELYLDFNVVGVLVFNIIIGWFLSRIPRFFKYSFCRRVILLNVLMNIFMIPRMAFSTSISFVINYYFWMAVIVAYVLYRTIKTMGNIKLRMQHTS